MSAPVRIDSNLGTIAFFALKKLIDDGVCTATTGFVGQNPTRNWVPPDMNYYTVTTRKQRLLNAETNTWEGELTVTANAGTMVDIAMRDSLSAVRTTGTGLQSMVNQVVNSLQLYDMTNGSFYFLAQPMRLERQDDLERYVNQDDPNWNWSRCAIVFTFVYGENPTYFNPQANGVGEFTYEFNGGFY